MIYKSGYCNFFFKKFVFFYIFFIWNKVNNKDKIEESKEKGNKIIKNNSNNNSINFNDIETTDLNIFKLHLLKIFMKLIH